MKITTADQRGSSLLEVLVATTIAGLVVVGIVGGYLTTVAVSSRVGERSDTESAVAAVSAGMARLPYLPCGALPAQRNAFAAVPVPDGFAASLVGVTYLDAATNTFGASCPKDRGAQLHTVEVVRTAPDATPERVSIVVRNPAARP